MRHIHRTLAAAFLALLLASPALAQGGPGGGGPGPGPTPNPWVVSGSAISYTLGGVLLGVPTGGSKGVGTINVSGGFYVNGTAVGGGISSATAPLSISGSTVSVTGQAGGILAGLSPAFTRTPVLGVAGSVVGSLGFANLTSGSITLQPVTGALGSSVLTLPAVTDTLACLACTQTLSNKTFTAPVLGAATGTSLALGGATLGTDALAVTGTANISGAVTSSGVVKGFELDTADGNITSSGAGWITFGTAYYGTRGTGNGSFRNGSAGTFVFTSGADAAGTIDTTISRASAGVVQIGTTASNAAGSINLTNLAASGTVRTGGFTVSGLPAAGSVGRRAYVTDATACTFLGALTGGGSTFCPVIDNGTAWVGG